MGSRGAAKTGGRKKGTPNKATAAKAAAIAASGLTPLDFMLDVMRNVENDLGVRLDAARCAAPYVHPKLSSVELAGKVGEPVRVERPLLPMEVKAAVAKLLEEAENELKVPVRRDLPDADRLKALLASGEPLPPPLYACIHKSMGGNGSH